jgi:multidrug resistance protein, MATE family
MKKKILALALPFLAANISIPLLGLVDTAVLGHLESEKYLGAIALGSMIFNFLFWGFSFLKMGTTGFTAQAKGQADQLKISIILKRGIISGLVIGVMIVILQKPVWSFAAFFIEGSAEVTEFARIYFMIRVFSAPAVFLLYVISGWLLGMQNAVFVLMITVIENVFNIAFNLTFIYVFDMRVDGVALGTVCAQYLALGIGFLLMFMKYRKTILKTPTTQIFQLNELFRYFRVNADIMIRTLALMFAFAFFTVQSSSHDDHLLAANMILMQFMLFFSYVTDGFAHAGESLSGYYYGARKNKALKLLISRLFLWSFCLALIFSGIYLVFFGNLLSLLTNQIIVTEIALHFKWWLVVIPLLSFSAYLWDGIFIGLTETSSLRNAMLISLFVIYLPTFYLGYPHIGVHALWLSMSLFMLSRGLILWFFFRRKIFLV